MVEYKRVENSNKFRQAAIRFKQLNFYIAAPRGTTAYKEYWDEEFRRCIEGYNADDGEFITGYNYFYLNYCQIVLVKEKSITLRSGKKRKVKIREREFPNFYDWDYYFFNSVEEAEIQGKHLVVLKARGKGYSFKCASMLCRNFYLVEESTSLALASEAEFLLKDGILTKAWDFMDFVDANTAWYKKRQKTDTKIHKRASLVVDREGVKTEVGYKSEIMGITLKNDPNKHRGKRAKLILYEESGKLPDLKEAWQVAQPSVEEDGIAFGLMIAFGTGGGDDQDYEGLKDLFYEPEAYNALEFENTWDEGATKPCGFFVPDYVNMTITMDDGVSLMDKDGNSNIPAARKYSLEKRQQIIKNASDKRSVDRYIAERPHTCQEAFLQLSGNIFPKTELIRQLVYIKTTEAVANFKQVGDLVFSADGELNWVPDPKPKDLVEYKLHKNDNPSGQIVIWEHPVADAPFGLYIACCLTPGEKVLTNKGLKSVEDIILNDKLINKEGEEVNINTLLRYDKVDEPIYKMHMCNISRPTTYTQEHPLYLSDTFDGEYNFVKAHNTKSGMWTKFPNFYRKEKEIDSNIWKKYKQSHTPVIGNPLCKEEFWWFVGHWLGDGFNHKQGRNYTVYSSFGKGEDEYLNKYKKIVTNLFNRKPHLKVPNGSNTHKFESKQLYLFLEDNFGKYAGGKYISDWVKYIPHKYKLQLVLGYLDSDGSVYRDRTLTRASFKSINRKLLNDIQDILFSLGIVSSFNLSDKAGTYNINGKKGKTKASYSLQVGKQELKKLADRYNKNHNSRKLRLAKEIKLLQKPRESKHCVVSENNKYIYIRIKLIEESKYTGVVYNFDCDTHTFLCQYCTTHNCDPYDHDKSGTDSLGSTLVYKRFQTFESYFDVLVAEYTGRPETAEEYYENVRKLMLYYRATLLFENERKGIYPYFQQKHLSF